MNRGLKMAKTKDSEEYFIIYHGEIAHEGFHEGYSDIQDALDKIEKDVNNEEIEICDIGLIKGHYVKLKSRIKISIE